MFSRPDMFPSVSLSPDPRGNAPLDPRASLDPPYSRPLVQESYGSPAPGIYTCRRYQCWCACMLWSRIQRCTRSADCSSSLSRRPARPARDALTRGLANCYRRTGRSQEGAIFTLPIYIYICGWTSIGEAIESFGQRGWGRTKTRASEQSREARNEGGGMFEQLWPSFLLLLARRIRLSDPLHPLLPPPPRLALRPSSPSPSPIALRSGPGTGRPYGDSWCPLAPGPLAPGRRRRRRRTTSYDGEDGDDNTDDDKNGAIDGNDGEDDRRRNRR